MEEYTIVTQGSATYLERTLGADELLDEVDRGMLVSNQISGCCHSTSSGSMRTADYCTISPV